MRLPPAKTAKSRDKQHTQLEKRSRLEKLPGWLAPVGELVRSLFLPRGQRRRTRPRLRGALATLQPLEARLLLTGPTANPDNYYDHNGGAINIPAYAGVLANDTGGNGPLSAVLVTPPSYGTLTLNSDGSLTYTNTTFPPFGGDSFTYEAYDGSTYSSAATVSIGLMVSDQPQVQPQQYSTLHDQTLTVSAPGVLTLSSDPNNIHLTAVLVSGPSHGTVQLNSDGSLTYTPAYHYYGNDGFSFEGYDGNSYSAAASASIDVTDQAPTGANQMYSLPNGQTDNVSAAQGVLNLASDPDGDSITAVLSSAPTHGTLQLNSDGSFSYTPNPGWIGTDAFGFTVSDGILSSQAYTATLQTEYSVLSASDQTKVPVDTIHVSRQILSDPYADQPITSPLPAGGSGGTTVSAAPADGAPATAHNLSLVYDSVLAQPDQVIEADLGLSTSLAASETVTATLTFNGVQQPPVYFSMSSLNGTTSHVHLAEQVDTSPLASGRYPWSLTVTSPDMAAPTTISGAINVVNDSASPFGKGWDMPGLYRLFVNNVQGVPAGVLLSTGDGGAWYYSQNQDGSYTSPNGPFAFSTLTAVSGGGWQLVTHVGVTFNFGSGGYLTSRLERTGEATSYNWSGADLTSIVDEWGRAVDLSYTNGLSRSISDYANSVWTIAHSGTNLTSITEPDPGNGQGAPVWQYAYSGDYMSSESNPNLNQTSFTLDANHRLSGVSLPGGASTSDTSEQDFGYGSTNSSSPSNLTLSTSVNPTSTDANGDQSGYQTNAFGEPISQVDPYGNTETIQRDANGLPTVITLPPPATGDASPVTNIYYDSTGDETYATGASPTYGTFTYTAGSFGQWATFTDSMGKEWSRTFDGKGDILTEQDPSGAQVSWTYDTYSRPLTMTMPAPNNGVGTVTVTYHYDSDERLVEIIWPDNSNEQFGYNADDYQASYQDENGHQTVSDVDVLGRVVSVTNAAGGVTSTTYDKDNNVLTTETPMGEVTGYEWNSRNEPVQETLPPAATGDASPTLAWTYDANGNTLTYTNALNEVTSETWDKLNRLASETLPAPAQGQSGPETTLGYDNDSRKTSETTALGTTAWAYANTDVSQLTSMSLPPPSGSGTGPTTSYFYDTDGRQNQVENALGQYTTTTFTVNGQTASIEDNLSHTTTYVYGNGGELLSTTDPLNHTQSDEYDSRYRLVQTTDANGGVTQITLDPAGNETKLVDSVGNATTWSFSPTNLPLTETNALGTTTWGYNADSLVTSIQDADARVRDFVYNNDRQLTAENWMSGTTIVAAMAYSYDLAGELTSAGDLNSAYAFAYNGDGQVTSVDNAGTPNVPHVILASGYDLMGDRTSLSATIAGTADFLNSYSYDADQNLTMVQQQDVNGGNIVSPKEVDYGYNAIGQFTSVAAYNFIGVGPREDVLAGAYSYDNGARLTGIAYTSNGGTTTIDTLGWGYNAG
ncbi:MAG TPA: Ig-like domain-containing protein, partial [Pirellulales bacterium]|nr:Ig-like domain-containing protein [Pirellulales bacterium]